jgi:hypothetical protein
MPKKPIMVLTGALSGKREEVKLDSIKRISPLNGKYHDAL